MEYGLCKKLVFLLYECHYENSGELDKDLCDVIHQLKDDDWYDLRWNYKECIQALQNIPTKYSRKPYSHIKDCDHLISCLEEIPVTIAEEQAERGIARSEVLGDYIYENGYDYYIGNGF